MNYLARNRGRACRGCAGRRRGCPACEPRTYSATRAAAGIPRLRAEGGCQQRVLDLRQTIRWTVRTRLVRVSEKPGEPLGKGSSRHPGIIKQIKRTVQAGIVSSSLAEGGQEIPGKVPRVIETTTLGRGGPVVSRAGLGLMSMSGIYGQADDAESIATIRAAVDAGVNLLDTGDFYGMGHNELLLRDALRHIPRDSVFIQVKFGGQRDPSGAFIGHDATPNAVKNSLAYSLTRLGTEYIDLYQPARLDPRVPIEDTVGAIVEMVQAGYVRHIGLSEVGADNIRRAHAVHPIAAVQLEYSLMSRSIEAKILPATRELGISVTAYGILSRGLLSSATAQLTPDDPRTRFPRFRDENHARNLTLLAALEALAEEHAVTAAQLAIAWVASRGKDIVPLIGTKRRERLTEALKALDLTLSGDDLAVIEGAVPADAVAGSRYETSQMAVLDSER